MASPHRRAPRSGKSLPPRHGSIKASQRFYWQLVHERRLIVCHLLISPSSSDPAPCNSNWFLIFVTFRSFWFICASLLFITTAQHISNCVVFCLVWMHFEETRKARHYFYSMSLIAVFCSAFACTHKDIRNFIMPIVNTDARPRLHIYLMYAAEPIHSWLVSAGRSVK